MHIALPTRARLENVSPCACWAPRRPSSGSPRVLLALMALVTGLVAPAASAAANGRREAADAAALGAQPVDAELLAVAGKETAPKADDDGDDDGVLAKVNAIYPIYLDPDLEPEVADKVVPLWLTSACFGQLCGSLWIPMLIVGEDPGTEYFVKEALIAIAIEMATNFVGGVGAAAGGIGMILITANLVYLTPVSIINTYDRALKRQRAKAAEKSALLSDASEQGRTAMAF